MVMITASKEIQNGLAHLTKNRAAILEERYWQAHAEGLKPKACGRDRSRTDYRLLCWLVDCQVDAEVCWEICQSVGKFADHGRKYFETTLGNVQKRER